MVKRHFRYLTHPQVRIDPAVAVPDWGLTELGAQRVQHLAASGALAGTTRVVSSAERKAIETAEPIAAALGISVEIREAMHENDRSATGFLPPPEFEAVANAFFARPAVSIRGWERAIDAQARIVREVQAVLAGQTAGDTLFVGHGGVGTLLLCHYLKIAITRVRDQPAGGGNVFQYAIDDGVVMHGWRPMEQTAM
jgi:broad specificity phosphatase PhoE